MLLLSAPCATVACPPTVGSLFIATSHIDGTVQSVCDADSLKVCAVCTLLNKRCLRVFVACIAWHCRPLLVSPKLCTGWLIMCTTQHSVALCQVDVRGVLSCTCVFFSTSSCSLCVECVLSRNDLGCVDSIVAAFHPGLSILVCCTPLLPHDWQLVRLLLWAVHMSKSCCNTAVYPAHPVCVLHQQQHRVAAVTWGRNSLVPFGFKPSWLAD
jgi:hypothetical protein